MLLRGRSKDRASRKMTPPGPSYMSNEQFGIQTPLHSLPFAPKQSSAMMTLSPSRLLTGRETHGLQNQWTADYLAELRNSRIKRPTGARPLPSSVAPDRRQSTTAAPAPVREHESLRTESAQSHRRAQSAMSNFSTSSRTGRALVHQPYPNNTTRDYSPERPTIPLKPSMVVPSATYIERGQRWMEKEEAVSLRDALEDLDLKKEQEEEARLHAAAQAEASELVWQYENPDLARSDGPYKYKEHLRKNSYAHARTQSVGRYSGTGITTGLARDFPRSVSSGSASSGGMLSQSRVSSGSSGKSQPNTQPKDNQGPTEISQFPVEPPTAKDSRKPYHGLTKSAEPTNRRRSSGKRNISGELVGGFTGEQIWEEPEDAEAAQSKTNAIRDMPAPLRIKPRNPLSKVQFAQEKTPDGKTFPPESVQKLSKTEIHKNPPSQSRDAAYTANPPPALSPVPNRTDIPSKDGIEIRADDIRQATSRSLKDRSPKLPTPTVVSDKQGRPIVSFDANWRPKEADLKPVEEPRRPRFESRYGSSEPKKLPSVSLTEASSSTSISTIQLPGSTKGAGPSPPPVPTIMRPPSPPFMAAHRYAPMISISGPASIPSINIISTPSVAHGSSRPLPDPKTSSSRPLAHHYATAPGVVSRRHWPPAVGNRATATCHQCELPIEGRVVALMGLSERFHPHCFICYTCGTSLEALEISPEPMHKRAERLSRIQRRARGERIEEIEGQTISDDGDDRLRFYCHLDWHELFAPRCKHCKTPIIGEHAVALGEHWHYGHFFCAECGDPFEQGMTHIEKDGYAWCLNCQTKRTERRAPKCKKCSGPVIGQYVQALGGEYHDECFRCTVCGGGFDDGQIFPRQEGNETVAVCVECMERELKA